jgi:hypothetical protein
VINYFFTAIPCHAQLTFQESLNNLTTIYKKQMDDQSGLFNGKKYNDYKFSFKENGHPNFKDESPLIGSIVYSGTLYPDVALQFDEISNVIVFHAKGRKIQLLNEKITEFKIDNTHFVHLKKNDSKGIDEGFYQLLHKNRNSIYKKEEKYIFEDLSSVVEGVKRYIKIKTTFYVASSDGLFYKIKKPKDLFEVDHFDKKRSSIAIKKERLSFKKDPEKFIVTLVKINEGNQ